MIEHQLKKITIVTPVLCPSEKVFLTIQKCFKSIRQAVNKVNGQWIVVDDNSLVGQEFFKQISDVYFRNETTMGVSYSLNRGMRNDNADFLVKLDSDYFVPENLFEILLKDWSDDLAFISPSFTYGRPTDLIHFMTSSLPVPEGGFIDWPSGLDSQSKYQWGGGVIMFDAKKLKEIDYFDEDFKTGSAQDNDVIYRILMKGYKWRWTRNVIVRHFASISSTDPQSPENRSERRMKGREFFKQKHGFEPGDFLNKVKRHFKYE